MPSSLQTATLGAYPGNATVRLGDLDLTEVVRGYTLHAGVGMVPRLVLDLAIRRTDVGVDGHPNVDVPALTRDALAALGWTPPVDDTD